MGCRRCGWKRRHLHPLTTSTDRVAIDAVHHDPLLHICVEEGLFYLAERTHGVHGRPPDAPTVNGGYLNIMPDIDLCVGVGGVDLAYRMSTRRIIVCC
jgi:hypothetical protein